MPQVTRRQFMTTTTTGLAGILAAKMPPAIGQVREVSYLCWNNFAPASDKKLAEIGQRFTKDTGIKLKIDHISHMGRSRPQVRLRGADAGRPRPGRDAHALPVALRAAARRRLGRGGRAREAVRQGDPVGLRVRRTSRESGAAVPQYHGMFVATYREDLFKKASLKVPDTWEELYTVGKELKKMGNPVGIPIAQNYDSISTAGPVLWSFGGMEVDKDGKTVRINSPATVQMIEWYKKMYQRLHGAGSPARGRTPATTSRSSRARRAGSTTRSAPTSSPSSASS